MKPVKRLRKSEFMHSDWVAYIVDKFGGSAGAKHCVVIDSVGMAKRHHPQNGGSKRMNLARVSTNGQITVPVEIRRALKIKEGDKVLFYQKSNGEIVINNTSLVAIQDALANIGSSSFGEDEVLAEIVRMKAENRLDEIGSEGA